MIKSLKNIQSAFSLSIPFLIMLIVSNLTIILFTFIYSSSFKKNEKEKIYSLTGEEPLMYALQQNTTDNRIAEAQANIERFHSLFFTIYPDQASIDYNLQKALDMADNTALDIYNNLKSNNFYKQIIDAKIICRYVLDSINVDFSTYPYAATMYGKTSIERSSSTTIRNLITVCNLRNCARTNATPHGFMIENLIIVKNNDIPHLNSLYTGREQK